jgi:hypothetical protein
MNRDEAIRQNEQENALGSLGFSADDAAALRRISMTLRRWYELECGTGDDKVTRSIERDPDTDKPFLRVQFPTSTGYVDRSYPTADREKGAIKRLDKIMARVNVRRAGKVKPLSYYLQTDPRGAALYIIRPGDVPEGKEVSCFYTRGLCVY